MYEFNTNVYIQENLKNHIQIDKDKNERFLVEELNSYLYKKNNGKVCILYGLRRTGKTTMIRHALLNMDETDFSKAAYVLLNKEDTIGKLRQDLKALYNLEYKYVFLDEITLLEDFIDVANIYSDVFATDGMKLVLTGTDSLGFVFANHSTLYNRSEMIHTTFVPYYEFKYVFPNSTIDEFIEYGGTFIHENDHSNPFYSMKNSQEYVDSAIVHNIQHSLENYDDGKLFYNLSDLSNYNELTNVINRFIQQKNRSFILRIVNKKFKSADFGSAYQILENRFKYMGAPNPMDQLDKENITKQIMKQLDIFNQGYGNAKVNNYTLESLNNYLIQLDLIRNYDVVTLGDIETKNEHTLFSQPGLRYSQVKELYRILQNDVDFSKLSLSNQQTIFELMDTDVKGCILEEIVLANTMNCLFREKRVNPFISNYDIFQIEFVYNNKNQENGEFDMVIKDNIKQELSVFEIKHSQKIVPNQIKHLINQDKLNAIEKKYQMPVKNKVLLYLGNTQPVLIDGVRYVNVNDYLDSLKDYDRNYQKRLERERNAWVQCLDDPFYVDKKGLKRSFEENGMEYTMVVWEENPNQYEIYDDANNLVENGAIEELDREDLKKRAKQLVNKMDERER